MNIAIHNKKSGFTPYWIDYLNKNGINFSLVDCYSNKIVQDIKRCHGLMWHFHQSNPKDILFAKQLLYSLDIAGYPVFPDYQTCWHFDDKIAQKYLLETIDAPLVSTYLFYDKVPALEWIEQTHYPKIFKLRTGSGASNVQLVSDRNSAKSLVKKAFGKGFKQYDPSSKFKERHRRYRLGKTGLNDLFKGIARFVYSTGHDRVSGREKGYVYFQDYIPGNDHDIRVNVIDGKAFAVRRKVRDNDFRASGSGVIDYDVDKIPIKAVEIALDIAGKLKLQSVAFDFLMDGENPKILEMSYGFGYLPTDFKTGYWDSELNFYKGEFNPFGWMVDGFVKQIQKKSNTIKPL